METLEAIFTRRSVRNFTDKTISEVDLRDLLKAGMQAPSAKNEQPWHFIVIDKAEILHAIPAFHPYADMLYAAPLAILVCSDRRLELKRASWIQDCSAATENILLAAHAKGLGAVWLGVFPDAERVQGMQTLLGLPPEIRPMALIAVGYPDSQPEAVDRFNPSRVHHNGW